MRATMQALTVASAKAICDEFNFLQDTFESLVSELDDRGYTWGGEGITLMAGVEFADLLDNRGYQLRIVPQYVELDI